MNCLLRLALGVVVASISSLRFTVAGTNCDKKMTAKPHRSQTFFSHGFIHKTGSLHCNYLFETNIEGRGIKVHVTESLLNTRNTLGLCRDSVVVYDGSTPESDQIGEFCGKEHKTYQSSGASLLLVFETRSTSGLYKGFSLDYSTFDLYDETDIDDSESGMDSGTAAATIIPALILSAVLFGICLALCKMQQRRNQRLEERRSERDGSLLTTSRALHVPREPLPQTDTAPRRTRVRHPAGDINACTVSGPLLLEPDIQILPMNGSGYLRSSPHHHRDQSDSHSNYSSRSHGKRSNGHCPQGNRHSDHRSRSSPRHEDLRAASPVNVEHQYLSLTRLDDDGRSRGSSRLSHVSTGSNSPRDGAHHGHRRHGSREAIHNNGRTSSQDRIHRSANNSPRLNQGRASPFHRLSPHVTSPLAMGEQHLTYYGMIDGDRAPTDLQNTTEVRPASQDVDTAPPDYSAALEGGDDDVALPPPPSYEDAADGKYSIHPA